MTLRELEEGYASLLDSEFMDRLELRLREPNIFRILNIEQAEIRHSSFLAWLFDPKASHNFGDLFLKRVLRDILMDVRSLNLSVLELEALSTDKAEIRREWRNIDLLIVTPEIVICIENKVKSSEHSDQLVRYKKIVDSSFPDRKKVFLYLSPEGNEASMDDIYINYSYSSLKSHLQVIKDERSHQWDKRVKNYITDYLIMIDQTINEDDAANNWARFLYSKHKELFDFVFENRPDIAEQFKGYFIKKVKREGWVLAKDNKGHVRFLTPSLIDIIPDYNQSSVASNWQGFVFDIDFYWSKQKALHFLTIIAPGDDQFRTLASDQLRKLNGALKPSGEKWLVHFRMKKGFDLNKLSELEDSQIEVEINKFWPDIKDLVEKIESCFMEKKDEFLAMKSRIENDL